MQCPSSPAGGLNACAHLTSHAMRRSGQRTCALAAGSGYPTGDVCYARTRLHVLLSVLMHMCFHLPLMLHPTPVPLFFGGASCSTIKAIIEGPPFQLLEAAAEAVSSALLAHDRRVGAVQVQLLKPHVAVPGVVDALGEWWDGAGLGVLGVGGWVSWRGKRGDLVVCPAAVSKHEAGQCCAAISWAKGMQWGMSARRLSTLLLCAAVQSVGCQLARHGMARPPCQSGMLSAGISSTSAAAPSSLCHGGVDGLAQFEGGDDALMVD